MLVDSGADISMIPFDVAEILQLKLPEDTIQSYAAAGQISVKKSEVEVWILLHKKEIRLGRVPVSVPIPNKDQKGQDDDQQEKNINFPLLGRKPFFEMYDITFQESRQKMSFVPASKPYKR